MPEQLLAAAPVDLASGEDVLQQSLDNVILQLQENQQQIGVESGDGPRMIPDDSLRQIEPPPDMVSEDFQPTSEAEHGAEFIVLDGTLQLYCFSFYIHIENYTYCSTWQSISYH